MTDINGVLGMAKNEISNIVKAVEDLGWYKKAFDFITRNYKFLILKSKNSNSETRILFSENYINVVTYNKYNEVSSIKFDTFREAFNHLMTWFDTDKQIEIRESYELNDTVDFVIEEEDGHSD